VDPLAISAHELGELLDSVAPQQLGIEGVRLPGCWRPSLASVKLNWTRREDSIQLRIDLFWAAWE
jgi:hypothetical protein